MPDITHTADVLVIGAGAAGLMAAIAAAETGADTLLVSDGPIGRSNTVMAQGGLHVPFDTAESKQSMIADIERSARVALNHDRVLHFVDAILPTIHLLEDWGLPLDRDRDGTLLRRSAGGLSEPRIVSAGDRIGPTIVKVLRDRLAALDIAATTRRRVVDIEPVGERFRVALEGEDEATIDARTVVIATGGIARSQAERTHERTTNPPNRNDTLFTVLRDLGVPVIHRDWFQYQPFGLIDVVGGPADRCVPESIVNLPIRLLDRYGEPVARPGADRLEVTNAIGAAVREGRGVEARHGVGVRLTLGDVASDEIAERFPALHRLLVAEGMSGVDVIVKPFLHYWLGGLEAAEHGYTRVPGILLAGEIVGGIHGRNRLMGAGITDALVSGRQAGLAAATHPADG